MLKLEKLSVYKILLNTQTLVRGYLGLVPPGRKINVLESDIWLVSYPKSGNTWLRFLLSNLLYPLEKVDFFSVNKMVPDIYYSSTRSFRKMETPRVIKSHEYFDVRYKKVIYVVRDPRDVVVSYFHHCKKFKLIENDFLMTDFLHDFLEGKIDPFGTWYVNVQSWLDNRQCDNNFLLLRYEDILDNPLIAAVRINKFLDINRSHKQLSEAIANSSFENMREMEAKDHLTSKKELPDRYFVRNGKSAGWETDLTQEQDLLICSHWGDLMIKLGYKLNINKENYQTSLHIETP